MLEGANIKITSMRRGKQRAILAVAHSILIAIYYMIKEDKEYEELEQIFASCLVFVVVTHNFSIAILLLTFIKKYCIMHNRN